MRSPALWMSIAAALASSLSLAASGWVLASDRGPSHAIAHAPSAATATRSNATHAATPVTAGQRAVVATSVESVHAKPLASQPTETNAPSETGTSTSPSAHAAAGDLEVKRLVVTSGVRNHEPASAPSAFEAGDSRVYAFVEMANRCSDEGEILISFEHGSIRTGMVELEVPANAGRWRTWGYTRGLRRAGTWHVVVREARSGKELARTKIEVESASPSEVAKRPGSAAAPTAISEASTAGPAEAKDVERSTSDVTI